MTPAVWLLSAALVLPGVALAQTSFTEHDSFPGQVPISFCMDAVGGAWVEQGSICHPDVKDRHAALCVKEIPDPPGVASGGGCDILKEWLHASEQSPRTVPHD
jgi:hypothetical protein